MKKTVAAHVLSLSDALLLFGYAAKGCSATLSQRGHLMPKRGPFVIGELDFVTHGAESRPELVGEWDLMALVRFSLWSR